MADEICERESTVAIDIQHAKEFLQVLDPNAQGFTFQTFNDGGQRRDLAQQFHGPLQKHAAELENLSRRGAAVAVCINETDLTKRSNDRIQRCRAVWCDYDRKNQENPKNLSQLLSSFPLIPSIVVESSPGNYHFYWLADELGRVPFAEIMDRLVADYGHDAAAKDAARVMRLPGFLHQKDNPHLVKIIDGNRARYHSDTLLMAFPPIEKRADSNTERSDVDPSEEWKKEKDYVRDALSYIPSNDRELWFKFGGALYDLSEGSDDGFEVWDEWSQQSAKKYDVDSQLKYWGKEFSRSRRERTTVASIYHHALQNGWPGKGLQFVTDNGSMPTEVPLEGGELTRATIASLRKTFEQRGHRPAESHWMALQDLAATLEAMSSGSLKPLYYVCSLAPGIGKTQTIVHFVRQLVASPQHVHAAVIIFVGRIAEIKNLVADMGLSEADYAVLVSDTEENKPLNSSGNPTKSEARVLFTTQQMLDARSRGKSFAELSEFYYRDKLRLVRIWDEAILPARPVCVNLSLIEGMTHVIRKGYPQLHKVITSLIDAVKAREDREFVEIPDFETTCRIDLNDVLAIFGSEKRPIKNAAEDLWLLSGKTVVVRREWGGNTVLDYKDTLPDDLKPVVVTDASGVVRKTYPHWSAGRGDLVFLKHADKDYTKLTVHIWKRGGGKQAWRDNDDDLVDGIVTTINSNPEREEWLIVHHKYDARTFPTDVPERVRLRVKCPVRAVHWGDHSASNEFKNVKNVILAGTLFYETSFYEALGRLSRKLKPTDVLEDRHFKEIKLGEHAHLILQALCRGSVRMSDGSGCYPCDAYIIADTRSGIPSMLEDGTIFPGCKVAEWYPVKKELRGRTARAFAFVKAELEKNDNVKVSFSSVRTAIGMGNDRKSFHSEVVDHPEFDAALANAGIVIDRNRGAKGNCFRKRKKPYSSDDLPF